MNENVFSLFAAFRVSSSHPITFDGHDVPGTVRELEDVLTLVADQNVTVHGWYDVSGTRADTDLLLVMQGNSAEDLQWSLRQLRRTQLLKPLIRTWGTLSVGATGVDSENPQSWIAVCQSAGPLESPCVIEAAEFSDLTEVLRGHHTSAGRHSGGDSSMHNAEPFTIGRFVEPVEIIEVLQ